MRMVSKVVAGIIVLSLVFSTLVVSCSKPAPTPTPTPAAKPAPSTSAAPAPKPTVASPAPAPKPVASPTPAAKPSPTASAAPRQLRFLDAPTGSESFLCTSMIAQRITKDLNIPCTAFPGGSAQNIDAMEKGEAELSAPVMGPDLYDAWNGAGRWQGKPSRSIRFLMTTGPVPIVFGVRKDSKVTKIEDIVNKKVAISTKGSMAEMMALTVLEVGYGITPDKITNAGGALLRISYSDMEAKLLDGTVDVIAPCPGLKQVHQTMKSTEERYGVRIIGPSEEAIAKVLKASPIYGRIEIKGGIYSGNPKPLPTVQATGNIICHKGLPEDLVYQITKLIRLPELQKFYNQYASWEDSTSDQYALLSAHLIPLHPGSGKYWQENGIDLKAKGYTVEK